jgi:hypothetical protein
VKAFSYLEDGMFQFCGQLLVSGISSKTQELSQESEWGLYLGIRQGTGRKQDGVTDDHSLSWSSFIFPVEI